jgi:16S rRNA (uracil1498-N3)-methyltransferase
LFDQEVASKPGKHGLKLMNLFYLPEVHEGTVQLTVEESVHCIRVLRMKAGDPILFTDGKGWFYEGRLTQADARKCLADLSSKRKGDDFDGYGIHIALGPTKQADRTEWFVEKATEMGIDEISFFISEHSERRHLQLERLNRVAVSAMKQSLKSRLPKINPLEKFSDFLSHADADQKYIAWINNGVQDLLVSQIRPESSALVLIGPEGDFSGKEVEKAMSRGYLPVSLGSARLRTETAALTACMGCHIVKQVKKP